MNLKRSIRDMPEVSHGYERASYAEWPYNVYTMIHGHSKDECLSVVERISSAIKIEKFAFFLLKGNLRSVNSI